MFTQYKFFPQIFPKAYMNEQAIGSSASWFLNLKQQEPPEVQRQET